MARARKGSASRCKKIRSLSRETYRNRVRNRNVCHRASTGLVRRFGRIAVEDLQIRNMVPSAAATAEEPGKGVSAKRGLNRSITEQTWGILVSQLAYKAEYAGRGCQGEPVIYEQDVFRLWRDIDGEVGDIPSLCVSGLWSGNGP